MLDGQQGLRQLDVHEEAVRQVAAADVVLLSKPDLAPEGTLNSLARRVDALCPGVPVRTVLHGAVDPDELFQIASRAALTVPDTAGVTPHDAGVQGGEGHPKTDPHHHDGHAHGAIRSLALSTSRPISWPRLRNFLETVFSLRGESFLRVKGIIRTGDGGNPLLIHGVGNTFSPPRRLTKSLATPNDSRIVLIFKDLEANSIHETFRRMVL
jgi:G3E family GTPase